MEVKSDPVDIVAKRYIEQLKLHRIQEKDHYKTFTPSCVRFTLEGEKYNSIYYNDEAKYIIVSNFKGGCSMSRNQTSPMDLDELLEYMETIYDKIDRETLKFEEPRKMYRVSDLY